MKYVKLDDVLKAIQEAGDYNKDTIWSADCTTLWEEIEHLPKIEIDSKDLDTYIFRKVEKGCVTCLYNRDQGCISSDECDDLGWQGWRPKI